MKRNVWIVVGVLAIVVGVVLAIPALSNLDEETSTETFQEVKDLVFDLQNSSVTLVGGDDTQTVVEMSVSRGIFDGDVSVEQSGGTLRLKQRCPWFVGWGCRALFSITLPSDVEVSGETSNGPITAESLDESVSLSTSNGVINVVEISAPAILRTSNGDIFVLEGTSREIQAETSNGRVQMEFDFPPGSVRATTSNGAIELILPPDAPAYAVDSSTSNGEVVTEIRTDPAAPDSIVASTSNGDITIRYAD